MNKIAEPLHKADILREGRRIVEMEIIALREISLRLTDTFADAVEMMAEAGKIIVSGIGKSGLIGRKIAATLVSTGTPAHFLHPVEALHGDIGIVNPGDCVLLLSKSGNTEELLKLVPVLKSRDVRIIGILGNTSSPLALLSDITLDGSVEREACPLNAAPMSSTTVALVIGDALAAALMQVRGITLEHYAISHPLGQLGRNITIRVGELMHVQDELPLIALNASFREAIIEMSDKKLGCVCVVDEEQRLLGIITDGDIRRTLQKYEDISALQVEDVMIHQPLTIAPDVLIGDALTLMENSGRKVTVLPVVTDEQKCLGVIHMHDIVRVGI